MIPNVFNFDFTEPIIFFWLTISFFFIVVFRYFLLASVFHLYFYVWKSKEWEKRKLNKKQYPPKQFREEMFWSMLTALIFFGDWLFGSHTLAKRLHSHLS